MRLVSYDGGRVGYLAGDQVVDLGDLVGGYDRPGTLSPMRRLLAGLNHKILLETGCRVLRLPLFRSFAAHVFFGRGSFPDDVKLTALLGLKTTRR